MQLAPPFRLTFEVLLQHVLSLKDVPIDETVASEEPRFSLAALSSNIRIKFLQASLSQYANICRENFAISFLEIHVN